MQCKKCGQENIAGVQLCQKCGSPLGQAEQSTWVPMWFGSRIIGALAVIAAVLVIVGVFIPWVEASWISAEPPGAHSASGSGWDLMTASGDVQDGVEPYAIIAFAGSMVLALGALWAFHDPESKFAWFMAFAGGVLAIVGAVWGWQGFNDIVFAGIGTAEASIDRGPGLDMTLGGGIAGVIASIAGRLGASEPRIRL